jgi:Ca2+-binding EF-hand superfamily protein
MRWQWTIPLAILYAAAMSGRWAEAQDRSGRGFRRGGDRSRREAPPDTGASSLRSGNSSDSPRQDDRKPNSATDRPAAAVPGFGTKEKLPVIASFDQVPRQGAAPANRSTAPSTDRGDRNENRGGGDNRDAQSADSRVRRYAEGLLRQYDENKNGTLEKDEWSRMRGDWQKADTNGDGIITVDELMAQLTSYSQRRPGDGGSGAATSPNAAPSTADRSPRGNFTSQKPRRFLRATERLPAGLPDWFTRDDADGDGQVTMAEFSSTWTDSKAAEFAAYDLNGDGTITPQECLAVEKKKKE